MTRALIPDWRLAWRFASVQAALLLALLSAMQADVLPLVQPLFPAQVWPWVSGGTALAIVLLRLLAQPGLELDRELLQLDALDRHQLAVDSLDASDIQEDWEQAMPAGRLEQHIGAYVLVLLLSTVAALGVLAYLFWGRP